MNEKRILEALRNMIANDDTMQYIEEGVENGTFHPDDDNAPWLEILQEAQQAYYEATGEVVANNCGVILIPGKANEDSFGFVIADMT